MPTETFLGFPQTIQENAGIKLHIWLQPLASTGFPIHFSLIAPLFGAI
jgi:hypothetical protein